MNHKKRKKKSSSRRAAPTEDILKAVPYANESMELTPAENGGALAVVPMRKPKMLIPPLSWLVPFSSNRRVQLDKLGASVLKMCNGKYTVEGIIDRFSADHKLTFREAQLAVIQFLKQLSVRGLVAVVGLNEDADIK